MRHGIRSLLCLFLVAFPLVLFARDASVKNTSLQAQAVSPPSRFVDENQFAVYVHIISGYTLTDWDTFKKGVFNNFTTSFAGQVDTNKRGGVVFGALLGYEINTYLALEGAWYYLPETKGQSNIDSSLPGLDIKSWLIGIAFRFTYPFSRSFNVAAKIGSVYRDLGYQGDALAFSRFGERKDHYWALLLALGAEYHLTPYWSISTFYNYIPKKTQHKYSDPSGTYCTFIFTRTRIPIQALGSVHDRTGLRGAEQHGYPVVKPTINKGSVAAGGNIPLANEEARFCVDASGIFSVLIAYAGNPWNGDQRGKSQFSPLETPSRKVYLKMRISPFLASFSPLQVEWV